MSLLAVYETQIVCIVRSDAFKGGEIEFLFESDSSRRVVSIPMMSYILIDISVTFSLHVVSPTMLYALLFV